jgi:hypothetical protein
LPRLVCAFPAEGQRGREREKKRERERERDGRRAADPAQ